MAEWVVSEMVSAEGGARAKEVAGRACVEVLVEWDSMPLRRRSTEGIRLRGFDSTVGFDTREGFGGCH